MSSFFPLSPPAHSFFIGPTVINNNNRETTAHFTALGMPAQQHCDSFRYRRAAFYNGLKSKVGLAAAKAAALRVNLNINGCSIVAPPARSSRSSRACLTDSVLSHSLPMPHVH